MSIDTIHKSYLCVGGPYAGRCYDAGDAPTFQAAYRSPVSIAAFDPNLDYSKLTVETMIYRTETFRTNQGDITLWVPYDQGTFTTMKMLLNTYEEHWKDK